MKIYLLMTGCVLFFYSLSGCNNSPVQFDRLLCEYAIEPDGIDTPSPGFSWIIRSSLKGHKQTACRIRVASTVQGASTDSAELWDSGKIYSDNTLHHLYAGKPLESNHTYFWNVTVWDNFNQVVTSQTTRFHTALLTSDAWQADWIGAGPSIEPRPESGFFKNPKEQYTLQDTVIHEGTSALLRKTIVCPDEIQSAWVYICGLGYYEMYLNGEKVGENVLAPAKTNYLAQVLYDTYEVTDLLKTGENAIGIHLGNGWFNPYKKWWKEYRMQWFGAKKARMQLHITLKDGSHKIFSTDKTWKTAPGPIVYNCVYDGEIYDANKEESGWASTNFDDSRWAGVNLVQAPGGKMISQQMPPIRVIETIEPASKFQITPDTVVYDLGQNFAGWVRVQISGDKGDRLTIRFAEEINADGSLNISSNEGARASAAYILKGNGTESYEPRFSFFGFRYVELTSDGAMPAISQVQGRVVHSANAPAGTFSCDNELINKIHRATVWSQKSNMIGYPLDCPQRDERLGWFGDAQVTAEEAMFNFDMALFFRNWLSGIQSNQDKKTGDIPIISPRPYIWDEGVEWSSTYIIITWYHYLYYGDKRVLAEHYESMKIYMTFLAGLSKDHILPQGWIGDWGSLVKGWKEGEPESVPTAFYYYNAIILSKIADVLDITADSARFKTLADQIKTAYNHRYFDAESGNYTDGSQMANAFPYLLDLVPQEYKAIVLKNLVTDIIDKQNSHLTTGVLGTKYMIDALTLGGRSDVAYKLVNQTGYPSWSDMVEKYTTLCEFWTLKQSHNHVMMGSIDAWFYKVLAGIRLDESRSAFQNIVISPFIAEGLNNAQAALETIRGKVVSKWEKTDDGLVMNIEIPFNCQAEIHFPATDENVIFENNKALKDNPDFTRIAPAVFKVPSGNYRFTVKN